RPAQPAPGRDLDAPPHREAADDRGLRLQALDRAALAVPAQRALLRQQPALHALRDAVRALRGRPRRREGGGPAPDPARRPRAELFDEHRAPGRLLDGEPLRSDLLRHQGALGPQPRRGEPGSDPDARGDQRPGHERPRVRRARQARRPDGAPDGLRPPRLQELRPAHEDHQARLLRRAREARRAHAAARNRRRARGDRAEGRVLRRAQALPERRLLLGRDLRRDRDAGQHVHRTLRDRPPPGLDRAVDGAAPRPRLQDRPPAPDLHRPDQAPLRAAGGALSGAGAAAPEPWVWVDGRLAPADEPVVVASDSAFQEGRGCYTSARVEAGRARFAPRHARRMARAARELRLGELDEASVLRALEELATAAFGAGAGIVRLQASRDGAGALHLVGVPRALGPEPDAWRAIVVRLPGAAGSAGGHKVSSRLALALAADAARDAGADEALVVDLAGRLVEGT